jgi:hypothetical protein
VPHRQPTFPAHHHCDDQARVPVTITGDLDGSSNAQRVPFGIDGVNYQTGLAARTGPGWNGTSPIEAARQATALGVRDIRTTGTDASDRACTPLTVHHDDGQPRQHRACPA